MRTRTALASLAVALTAGLGLALPALPTGVRPLLLVALAVAPAAATAATARSTASRLLALALGLGALAWADWYLLPAGPSPNAGDALFVAEYLLLAAALVLLAHERGVQRAALLDGLALAVTTGTVSWLALSAPFLAGPGPLPARLVSTAYPLLDALLLGAVVPVALSPQRTRRSLLLLGFVTLQLLSDVAYDRQSLAGTWSLGSWSNAGWLLGYALLTAAALVPDAPARRGDAWARRALLAMTLVPLPVVLVLRAVQQSGRDVALVGAASLLVTGVSAARAHCLAEPAPPAVRAAVRRAVLRLTAGVVLLAALPLAGMTALVAVSVDGEARNRAAQDLAGGAAAAAAVLQQYAASVHGLAAGYAARPALAAPLALANRAARVGAARAVTAEAAGLTASGLAGIWVLDDHGAVLAATPATVAATDLPADARRAGPGALLSAQFAAPGGPVVAAAAAVRAGGRQVGDVVVAVRTASLAGIGQTAGSGRGVRLSVLDQRGNLLLGPAPGPQARAALAGRAGRSLGGSVWRVWAPVSGLGWAVVTAEPRAAATATATRLVGRVDAVACLLLQVLLGGLVSAVAGERRRRTAELELAHREEQVSGILAAAGDAFISLDARGGVVRWNAAAEAVFGWTAREATGRPLHELIVPEELRQAHWAALLAVAAGGQPRLLGTTVEVEALRRDGTRFPAELHIWGTTADGAGTTFSAFLRDVTARHRDRADLEAARDEALAASRLKSQFVANMSHEIRTPMNGVLGMTELLLGTDLSDAQRDMVGTVQRSGDALLTVLNDVLDFSKIEAGKLELEDGTVGLRPLLDDVAALLAASAAAKGLAVRAEVDPRLPEAVRGDGNRLRQVLLNLVSNAVKFTDTGSVELSAVAQGGRLRLAVRDTGCGIAGERQADLFEAFRQADASTTRRYGGTGLGLTISRQLVGLMGGTLTVLSEPGRGSTFTVDLPLVAAASAVAAAPVPAPRGASPTGRRALVVEDNPVNQAVAVGLLAALGWTADVAAEGAQALARLAGCDRYALVLMDCQMPVLDGLEATRRLRAGGGPHAGVTVVALTASAMPEDETACREAGMDGFVAKPLRLDALAAVLEALGPVGSPLA